MSSVAPRDIVRIGKMALADHIDQLVSRRPGMTGLGARQISVRSRRLSAAGQFNLSAPVQGGPP